MIPHTERTLTVARAVVHEVRTERLTFMAGSIAYHAFVSLLPLLLLVLAVIASVGNTTLEEGFIQFTGAVLTPGASEVLVDELETAGQSTGVSLVGGAVLVWGTLRIFRGLDTAFSAIYESESENTFTDQLSDGLLVLVTFGLAIIAAVAIESVLGSRGSGPLAWVLGRAALVVGLGLTFYPIYYVFPDVDVSHVEILPGVAFAAVGLTVFESLFRVYVQFRDPEGSFLVGILVLLTWLYVSGLVILLGAAINAVLSNRSRDVNIEPVFGGVPLQVGTERGPEETMDREELVAELDRLEGLLAEAAEVDVVVHGERVTLPRPGHVTVTSDRSLLLPDGPVSVEFRWSPGRP